MSACPTLFPFFEISIHKFNYAELAIVGSADNFFFFNLFLLKFSYAELVSVGSSDTFFFFILFLLKFSSAELAIVGSADNLVKERKFFQIPYLIRKALVKFRLMADNYY